MNAKAGEYILSVNGKDLRPPTNIYSLFENTSGRIVELTLGPNADGTGSRTVQVVPVGNESNLRNRDWVEGNLKKVEKATGGRVAYVYVPNTASAGYTSFNRYFYPQVDKDAIIIDERFNSGGLVPDYYIDTLRRPLIAQCGDALRRGSEDTVGVDPGAEGDADRRDRRLRRRHAAVDVPQGQDRPAHWQAHLGWPRRRGGTPVLMDGGMITAPNAAFWTPEDGWTVENEGVPPDIEVEQTPADVIAGRDPQLEKAIEVVMAELKKNPPASTPRPAYPVRGRTLRGTVRESNK